VSLLCILNGADIGTTRIRLRSGKENGLPGLTTSANGQGSIGGVVLDDPTANLTVRGWMPITVDETDCVGATRIGTGYVGERTYQRGSGNSLITGAAREIDTDIYDPMTLLSFLLITEPDGNRPAETHNARITWLLASNYIPGHLITDLGLVDASHPRPFPATDYRGKFPVEVLTDIAAPIFKTFFVYWDQTAHSLGLFFDDVTAVTNTATLTISNVAADVNNTTCFYPSKDARLGVDPSSVYAKGRQVYRNGVVIENNNATATTFFTGLGYRGVEVDNDRNGLETTARTQLDSILSQDSLEAETLQFTVQLPSTKVGLIDAGMRLGVRFQHLPGYETLTYIRVEGRTIMQSEGTDKQYDVQLTCSNHGLTTAVSGGDPGNFPAPRGCTNLNLINYYSHADAGDVGVTPLVWGSGTPTQGAAFTPTAGNVLLVMGARRDGSVDGTTPTGWTKQIEVTAVGGEDGVAAFTKVSDGTETQFAMTTHFPVDWVVFEVAGVTLTGILTASTTKAGPASTWSSGSISPTAGQALFIAGCIAGENDTWLGTGAPAAGWTEYGDFGQRGDHPHTTELGQIVTSASGSYNPTTTVTATIGGSSHVYSGVTVGLYCESSSSLQPIYGQWVYDEVPTPAPDGVTVLFTLANPYVSGSLRVKVDGVPILNGLTQTDPVAGTFTLDFAPLGAQGDTRGEIVTATYQVGP